MSTIPLSHSVSSRMQRSITPHRNERSRREIERAKRIMEMATDIEHGFVSAFKEYAALKKLLAAVFDPTQIAVALMQVDEDAQQEH